MKIVKIKLFKYLALFLASIILILTSAIGVVIYLYPKEKVLAIVSKASEENLKRRLTIDNLSYSWRGIVLTQVSIHDGLGEKDPVIARVKEINLGIDFLALINKEIKFNKIYLDSFMINIVFNNDGVSNIQQLITDLIPEKKDDTAPPISAKISKILLNNAIITLKNPPSSLKPLEGTFNITGVVKFDKSNSILLSECTLVLPGERGILHPDLTIIPRKDFLITGGVQIKKVSLIWVYQWGDNVTVPYNVVTGEVKKLKITNEFVEGYAKATSTLRNSPNIVFADGYTKVSIKDRTVYLGNVEGKVLGSSFFINSLFFTFDGKLINFNITNINANITDVLPLLKFLPKELFGKLNGSLAYDKKMYNGQLRLTDVGFDARNKILSGISTTISVDNNLFKKENIPLKIYQSPSLLSIASIDKAFDKIFINLSSDMIKLAFDEPPGQNQDKPMNMTIEILGRVDFGRLQYNDVIIDKLQFNYSLFGNTIKINTFSTVFMEGKINGKGSVELTQRSPIVQADFEFDSIKVQNYASLSENFKNRFFGFAKGKANMSFEINKNIFKTIDGNVEFNISKGKLVNTGIQNGLGATLAELKYKISDLEFNTIYGNFDIKRDLFLVNSFVFNSDDIRLNVKGSFNGDFVANPLHLDLEFTKYLTQDLAKPAVKLRLGKYEKGNWYIVPFIINGDFTDSKNIKMQ